MRLPRVIIDYRDFALSVDDWATYTAGTQDVARDLGFERVAALHSRSLIRRSSFLIRHDTYPMNWDHRLVARGYKIIDPILAIARRRIDGFLWADALARVRLTDSERAILEDARRFGIRQGFTVPANVPGEPEGSISFATRSTRKIGSEQQFIVNAIGRLAFDAARRLAGYAVEPGPVPQIGDRVRECIYWIARGKSDQDIADILGISHASVRTYVRSAFETLDVITRAQLVHEALRLGLIDFEPSIRLFR